MSGDSGLESFMSSKLSRLTFELSLKRLTGEDRNEVSTISRSQSCSD